MKAKPTFIQQLKVVAKPKNILRTIGASFPGSAQAMEMINQIEGEEVKQGMARLRDKDLEIQAKLLKLEQVGSSTPPKPSTWAGAAAQFAHRLVTFVVSYDRERTLGQAERKEFVVPVGHGCFVDAGQVLTCVEVLESAQRFAKEKHGRLLIVGGYFRYTFEAGEAEEYSGLVICRIGKPEEESKKFAQQIEAIRGPQIPVWEPDQSVVKSSTSPWFGDAVGFIHMGEASDVWTSDSCYDHQFELSWISYFRKPSDFAFKSFVTSVLSSSLVYAGSPVFTQEGILIGIISAAEKLESELGPRAVVKSLLGTGKFMKK
jgi:hypothetical protein